MCVRTCVRLYLLINVLPHLSIHPSVHPFVFLFTLLSFIAPFPLFFLLCIFCFVCSPAVRYGCKEHRPTLIVYCANSKVLSGFCAAEFHSSLSVCLLTSPSVCLLASLSLSADHFSSCDCVILTHL